MDMFSAPVAASGLSAAGTSGVPMPDVRDIAAFQSVLAQAQPAPEMSLINAVGQQQRLYAQTMESLQPVVGGALTPEAGTDAGKMMAAQYGLFTLSFNLDLTAKVAGQFSQAVNKLVSMQ
ncbi:type III secretion system inner rod subunit SctI [Citrobacter freundii]|nr:type III secretion system inner rod subunit SctI [Citrobacter freundii]